MPSPISLQTEHCSFWETISIYRMMPTNAAPLVLGQLKSWSAFTGNSSFGCFSADVGTAMIFVHAAHAFCKTGKEQEHQHPQQLCVQATKSVQCTQTKPLILGRFCRDKTFQLTERKGSKSSPAKSVAPRFLLLWSFLCPDSLTARSKINIHRFVQHLQSHPTLSFYTFRFYEHLKHSFLL